MNILRIGIGVAVLTCTATGAAAQFPRGAEGLSANAVADSQVALRAMDTKIAANKKDAGAWHRRGMIAWALALRADTVPKIDGLDDTRLLRLADTSLRIAVLLEPKNVLYQLAIGTLLRTSTVATTRFAAISFFDKALDLARATHDSALHATAAIEAARVRWLRYDTNPNRMPPCGLLAPNVDSASIYGADLRLPTVYAFKTLHNQLADCFGTYGLFESGDYITSEALFRESLQYAPHDVRPFRHLTMLLVERKRWAELESLARDRLKLVAGDAQAWLVLGLAQHRGGKSVAAATAFDSGAAHLDPAEKRRLFAFTRLLTPSDSVAYAAAGADEREARERALWTVGTPLWSRPAGDPHTEFFARVVFAEVRWTVDELGVRGADSDRGEMHIRYGPPDRVYGLRGCDFYPPIPTVGDPAGCGIVSVPPGRGTQRPPHAIVVTYWDYDNGMTLVFWGSPTYGTSYFPTADQGHIGDAVELRPVSFDNMVRETIVDIPTRTARFRATTDSVDLLLAMHAPVADIRKASSLDVPARVDFWMYPKDRATGREYRDSSSMRGSGVGRWIYRLPANEYFYRVEATADGSMKAARTMGWITAGRDSATGFATRGFGMSDLLLATEARPTNATARRWTDYSVAPLIAGIAKGGSLQLIWENYELAPRDGQANYSIAVTLERQRSTAGRIATQVLNTLAKVVGVDRDPDRVVHRFERAAAHAPVIVDFVALSLAETPAGSYRVSVEITDNVSGRKTRSTSIFDIEEKQ